MSSGSRDELWMLWHRDAQRGLVAGRPGPAARRATGDTRPARAFLRPAWGHRLPVADIVHGDLNRTNLLAKGGEITGVVDWDDVGLGSRALDLTGPLFDWYRLRLAARSWAWTRTLVSTNDKRSPAMEG